MIVALLVWAFVSTPIALIILLAGQFIPFLASKRHITDGADAANPGSKEHRGG